MGLANWQIKNKSLFRNSGLGFSCTELCRDFGGIKKWFGSSLNLYIETLYLLQKTICEMSMEINLAHQIVMSIPLKI